MNLDGYPALANELTNFLLERHCLTKHLTNSEIKILREPKLSTVEMHFYKLDYVYLTDVITLLTEWFLVSLPMKIMCVHDANVYYIQYHSVLRLQSLFSS